MPIGVIVNVLAVAIGGILGAILGHHLSEEFKDGLNLTFSICSMGIGISSIVHMQNMPAVVFAMIIGTGIGLLIHLGKIINNCGVLMQKPIARFFPRPKESGSEEEFLALLITTIVLFCASGTGIYGSLDSGMTGDHSILISKAILDLFTAMIFACNLGYVVSVVAIPQAIIFLVLFYCAKMIVPLTTDYMISDFKACGGLLMVATGFRIAKIKMYPIADMIPAMILVMPFSWMWVNWILPLVS